MTIIGVTLIFTDDIGMRLKDGNSFFLGWNRVIIKYPLLRLADNLTCQKKEMQQMLPGSTDISFALRHFWRSGTQVSFLGPAVIIGKRKAQPWYFYLRPFHHSAQHADGIKKQIGIVDAWMFDSTTVQPTLALRPFSIPAPSAYSIRFILICS